MIWEINKSKNCFIFCTVLLHTKSWIQLLFRQEFFLRFCCHLVLFQQEFFKYSDDTFIDYKHQLLLSGNSGQKSIWHRLKIVLIYFHLYSAAQLWNDSCLWLVEIVGRKFPSHHRSSRLSYATTLVQNHKCFLANYIHFMVNS